MRRSRFNDHSAQRTALGELGLYKKPTDCDFELRIGGTPSETLFQNLPVLGSPGLIGVNSQIHQFLTASDIAATKWESDYDSFGASAPELRSGAGGGVILESGNVDGSSYYSFNFANEVVAFEEGKNSWILFDMKIDDTGDSGESMGIYFGFQEDGQARPTSIASLFLEINFVTDTSITINSWAPASEHSNTLVPSVLPSVDDGKFHRWGIHIMPSESFANSRRIAVFFDCIWLATSSDMVVTDEPLHPYVGTVTPETKITLRRVVIIQED